MWGRIAMPASTSGALICINCGVNSRFTLYIQAVCAKNPNEPLHCVSFYTKCSGTKTSTERPLLVWACASFSPQVRTTTNFSLERVNSSILRICLFEIFLTLKKKTAFFALYAFCKIVIFHLSLFSQSKIY